MYEVEYDTLIFSTGELYRFESAIAEVLDFEEAIIVRLGTEPMNPGNENILSFSYDGRLLWKIPALPGRPANSPYTAITRNHLYVDAFNWDGRTMTLHPKDGIVITEGYIHTGGQFNGRIASARNWV
jgi:hypothetical protein